MVSLCPPNDRVLLDGYVRQTYPLTLSGFARHVEQVENPKLLQFGIGGLC